MCRAAVALHTATAGRAAVGRQRLLEARDGRALGEEVGAQDRFDGGDVFGVMSWRP
jgi:hypothetical protein